MEENESLQPYILINNFNLNKLDMLNEQLAEAVNLSLFAYNRYCKLNRAELDPNKIDDLFEFVRITRNILSELYSEYLALSTEFYNEASAVLSCFDDE